MNVSSVLVDTSRPLGHLERQFYTGLCAYAQRNFHPQGGVDRIDISRNLADQDEAPFLFGPAICGRIASNAEWRVQMENVNGRWKVRSLIIAAH